MNYKKHILNNSEQFFREYLKNGLSITKEIFPNLKNGLIYTYAPANITPTDLECYTSMGIVEYDPSMECVMKEMSQYLEIDKDNIIIIEVMIANKGDKFLEDEKLKLKYHKDEVYAILNNNNLEDSEYLLKVTNNAWCNIIHFTKYVDSGITDEFTSKEIIQISASVKKIAIMVYDGDGYLYWENPG